MLIAALVILLSVALLAIPFELDFHLSTDSSVPRRLRLRWLFGLLRIDLRNSAPDRPASRRKPGATRRPANSRRRAGSMALLRNPAARQRCLRFARDAWQAIGKHGLCLRLRIGLGDPADTGCLWALLGPLAGYLASIGQAQITLQPDFTDSVFEGEGRGRLRLIPLRFLYLVTGLLLSPPMWRAWKQMRGAS